MWTYKLIRVTNTRGTIGAQWVENFQIAEKQAWEMFKKKFPNYQTEYQHLSLAEQEKWEIKEFNPTFWNIMQEFYPYLQLESVIHSNYRNFNGLSFDLYLELLINKWATQGWELDKIYLRENSGYLLFRKLKS